MAKKKKDTKKIQITCYNAAGKYMLGYSYGDVVVMEAKQADELIDAGDAKEIK
jgi:hypothetical protein